MRLTEAQLYDMNPYRQDSSKTIEYFQRVTATHYRLDHKMAIVQIAKRLGIKMKEVKELLGE